MVRRVWLNIMKTNLITREGYEALQKELKYLWREYRPEITKKVTWAASLGDRSENADYQYNKKILREIDRRVRYVRKCLDQLKIVDYSPQQDGKVFFGAWVEIANEEDEIKKIRIVGGDEIYGRNDYISIDSPMARALLKKGVDDEVIVPTPKGEKLWFVNSIAYVDTLIEWAGESLVSCGFVHVLAYTVVVYKWQKVILCSNNGFSGGLSDGR